MIVAVLALLAAHLYAANGQKNQSKIAQCACNLRQLSLSMLLYGGDNSEKLPVQTGGNWLWDMEWNVGNTLNKYGTPQENMYCPGTAPRFNATNNEELYEYYAVGLFHVIGYAPTLPGSPTLDATNVNATLTPQPLRPSNLSPYTIPPEPASRRVLVADATITHPGTPNWVFIPGAYRVPHISPHLEGFVPAGGNVAMLDGHVQWRNFSQMRLRTSSGAQTLFYW
jgi:prepilin-type processing-associated H-X9-DG protein